jgi:2-oxoglutarate dehydrogenase E2 component (dihydrolipoamide succinyltransferase)
MPTNIVVPQMGESIVDARIGKWLKHEGDAVTVGEPLVELETDKVDLEVSAPQTGVLGKIAHGDGADVKIGDVLGTIEVGSAVPKAEVTPAAPKPMANAGPAAPKPDANVGGLAAPKPDANVGAPGLPAEASGSSGAKAGVPATPSARRLAREEHVPLSSVQPAGPRVTANDVAKTVKSVAPAFASGFGAASPPSIASVGRPAVPVALEERIRMSKRRATIAKRLVEVQQTAAMLTTFNEVDMSAVMALRERQEQAFKEKHGVGLGIASFFVKAVVIALREFPRLNAEIQGDEMVLKHFYDIGVAVGAAEGLVVPVLHGADRLTFAEVEIGIRAFATKANDSTLTLDDLRGGTFTITNGGVFGSLMSTPILNPPQVGILGLHAIKERPVGVNGQVVLRPMMYTALTYDHRIVDGADAVRFLVRIKDLVEDPGVLLIEG